MAGIYADARGKECEIQGTDGMTKGMADFQFAKAVRLDAPPDRTPAEWEFGDTQIENLRYEAFLFAFR